MLNSIEKILYLIFFLIFSIIRKYYTSKYRTPKVVERKVKYLDLLLLSLNGLGMVIPLIYVFSNVLEFADYRGSFLLTIAGIIILLIANGLLWFSHRDLGSNWTPTLGITKEHSLIENGIYKYIRHPMYAAHIYWGLGQLLILPNWIAGFSFIVFAALLILFRLKDEEDMMISQFGEAYIQYSKRTGIIFPKIKW